MKRNILLFSFFLFSSIGLFAQAPQGVNYQAVAYNTLGVPVANQTIGLRLSILDGSATGTIVYQETQTPNTDNTGLFSVVIGNGTVVSGVFSNIKWETGGSKWLRTEIDITGGTSYVLVGSSQFMSVPYALYAKKALTAANSFEQPDGFTNITLIKLYDSVPYTVPPGKNLYFASRWAMIDTITFAFAGGAMSGSTDPVKFLAASPGRVVRTNAAGYLVDKVVDWIVGDIACTPYTVPAGKMLVIASSRCTYYFSGWTTVIYPYPLVNGVKMPNATASPGFMNGFILDSGDVLSITNGSCATGDHYYIIGYLLDK